MRQFLVSLTVFLAFTLNGFSQNAAVFGVVKDGKTGELLESATVLQPPANGTTTDAAGKYELNVTPGEVTLIISYLGMSPDTQQFRIKAGERKELNLSLGGGALELQGVVIGESKIGVKIQKVTQSVDIMKPRMLENNNVTNLQQAVTKIPGVTVLDGQMSIRGGSGYAYGSGSRVTLVVDEVPLMTADRGDIKWAFIPVENIEQMELIKGASTVQYGSSALNGVLNVTTAYARDTPSTRLTFFYEGMGKPPVDSFQWWKRDGKMLENPNTAGMSFLHKQKFGEVDFVLSGMMQGSRSHLNEEYDHFTRYSSKIRWQPTKLKRLTLELSTNLMYRKSGFQFYWQDAGHPYIAESGVSIDERYFFAFIDPKIKYIDKKNNQHKILARFSRQNNLDGLTDFWIYRLEYQFRHDFGKLVRLMFGVNDEHSRMEDGTLGKHSRDIGGGFIMADFNYKWFSAKAGIREEFMRLDDKFTPTIPVINLGLNFEVKKYNYIRASFAQSFRFPSVAEQFVEYQLGPISIVPNPDIRPESGFTTELGYKRSIKIGNWLGYFDAVLFWTEFKDMIEFTFDIAIDENTGSVTPYFQSRNVSKARIFGWELSTYGEGKIGPVDFTTLFGYTYFYGVDLNDTTSPDNNVGTFLGNAFRKYSLPTAEDDYTWDSLTVGMLKYRNPHTFKADFDFIFYDKVRFGTSFQYYGYMTKVDKVFEVFIKDIKAQRREYRNRGDFIWDLRAGYNITPNVSLNFLVKNVLNRNYAIRVARPDRPRTFTVQLVVNFGGAGNSLRDDANTRNVRNM